LFALDVGVQLVSILSTCIWMRRPLVAIVDPAYGVYLLKRTIAEQ
jgi:hypothetical protein